MNAPLPRELPGNLDAAQRQVVERIAGLLENQSRNERFGATVTRLVEEVHGEMFACLRDAATRIDAAGLETGERDALRAGILRAMARGRRLDAALDLLFHSRRQHWQESRLDLRQVLFEFNRTLGRLAGTLIEKDLLERQSSVLEKIILSHEKISQWKAFVQEILASFQSVFTFDFFFVAFAEEHGLSLNLYYVGEVGDEVRQRARSTLSRKMLRELKLPEDAPLDIEEFDIPSQRVCGAADDIELITVAVPQLEALNLAGLLGIAYGRNDELSQQEASIIRSVLAVMVMVVGSSKALNRTLSELEYYSAHDPLTGLYNRRQFNDIMRYETARSERHRHEFSVLMLDLDDFKDVNDTYGHPCGDIVLKQVAEIAREAMRKGDVISRIGGDEFAVVLPETGRDGAVVAAETLRGRLRDTAFADPQGRNFYITTSVGVVTYPGDAQSIDDLMAGVDVGLYRAKQLGKDNVCTLDAAGKQLQASRQTRDHAEKLRTALKEGRIVPYFQPILDCRSGQVVAYETLARLLQPNGETLSAGAFIATIERYGLGRDLDRAVIRQALAAMQARLAAGGEPVRLFINLSAQEIQGRGVLGFAEEVCAELGLPPSAIVFEILERDAIGDMTHMRSFLSALRERGFLFALDDFGSGYNSFHYLRELRFDYVKIDGAFVRNILTSKIDQALVRNLSRLCQDLGIRAVAEFVESAELWEALRAMGIDYGQGYHLGMPTPRMP